MRRMGTISGLAVMCLTVATLAQEAETQRESTQRVVRMQEDVQDLRQAFRTAIVPSLAVRTSLNTGGR